MLKAAIHTINEKPGLFAGFMAALILFSAYGFQLAGYAPCELCWWQRYPYMAIISLTVIGLAIRATNARWFLLTLAGLFLLDAAIAGFHVGVEQKWWEGLSTCSASLDFSGNLDAALDSIMNAPLVRCDDIAWSLFGISMAGYNFLLALGLGIFCLRKAKASQGI